MSKTLGLALGSGGSRGIAHVGFLQALEEEGIKPDYIAGCSMGAVVGGCYAGGMTIEEIRKIALKLKKTRHHRRKSEYYPDVAAPRKENARFVGKAR